MPLLRRRPQGKRWHGNNEEHSACTPCSFCHGDEQSEGMCSDVLIQPIKSKLMARHHAAKNKQSQQGYIWQLTTDNATSTFAVFSLLVLFLILTLLSQLSTPDQRQSTLLQFPQCFSFPESPQSGSLGSWWPEGERVMNRIARGNSITTWTHRAVLMRNLEQVNSAFFPPRRPLSRTRYSRSRGKSGPLVRPIRESFMPWLSLPLIPNILNIRSSPSPIDLSFLSQK